MTETPDNERDDVTEISDSELGPAPGGTDEGGAVLRPDAPGRGGVPARMVPPAGGPVGRAEAVDSPAPDFVVAEEEFDPLEDRRAERRVSLVFLLSALGTVGFIVAYIWMKIHTAEYGAALNRALGLTLFVALTAAGVAFVMWAKTLIPHEFAVQDRHDGASSVEARAVLEQEFLDGADRLGIARRPMLRRTMLLAAGVLPLPALVILRDLGPAPEKTLRRTAWRNGKRLVDVETKQPIKLGDMKVGGIATVMPEGFEKLAEAETATSPTILIRMRPEEIELPTRKNWTVQGHVAYSKVCTHAGCPTSLYEQQTKHLLCPCHQSTFQANQGCRVIFGPAARALPQLPISVDQDGYFVATGDYAEPVGPSFWERG